jgi:hypothetical protein
MKVMKDGIHRQKEKNSDTVKNTTDFIVNFLQFLNFAHFKSPYYRKIIFK